MLPGYFQISYSLYSFFAYLFFFLSSISWNTFFILKILHSSTNFPITHHFLFIYLSPTQQLKSPRFRKPFQSSSHYVTIIEIYGVDILTFLMWDELYINRGVSIILYVKFLERKVESIDCINALYTRRHFWKRKCNLLGIIRKRNMHAYWFIRRENKIIFYYITSTFPKRKNALYDYLDLRYLELRAFNQPTLVWYIAAYQKYMRTRIPMVIDR